VGPAGRVCAAIVNDDPAQARGVRTFVGNRLAAGTRATGTAGAATLIGLSAGLRPEGVADRRAGFGGPLGGNRHRCEQAQHGPANNACDRVKLIHGFNPHRCLFVKFQYTPRPVGCRLHRLTGADGLAIDVGATVHACIVVKLRIAIVDAAT